MNKPKASKSPKSKKKVAQGSIDSKSGINASLGAVERDKLKNLLMESTDALARKKKKPQSKAKIQKLDLSRVFNTMGTQSQYQSMIKVSMNYTND